MTGGGNFNGSHTLKTVSLNSGYYRRFDSRGPAETVEGGISDPVLVEGAAAWHEFFALRTDSEQQGFFLTFDYAGTWFDDVGTVNGKAICLNGYVHMHNHSLSANDTLTTPKAMTGIFVGDIDNMGNAILYYQYMYKWDLTNEDYFAKANVFDFLGYQTKTSFDYTPNVFAATNNARTMGVEINVIDDFWYDRKGDWNSVDSEDFALLNEYISNNGQKMCVWMAPWHAQTGSNVLNEHPDWQVENDNDYWYNWHLEQSNEDVIAWELALMNEKQEQWGAYMLKYDGEPMWPTGNTSGTPMELSDPSCDNMMLESSNNWYQLIETFKKENPNAGIYHCSSGGELMTIEALRFAEVTSTSDGNVGDINGYWNSLLFPIDKLMQGGYAWGTTYQKSWRWDLRFAPQLNMRNPWAEQDPADTEAMRKDFELYRYMREEGVVGRWVKIYRPTVSAGAIAEHYLQKMDQTNSKGVILTCSDDNIGNTVTIYPKGLIETMNYSIIAIENGTAQTTRTGAQIMSEGITLSPYREGEMIFLNMNSVPGYSSDETAPTVPANVVKCAQTRLYHPGIELTWDAATDNEWLSYYEITKNGAVIDKVSIGTYYFDAYGSTDDIYQICAVDGAGNRSSYATATLTGSSMRWLNRDDWTITASYANEQAQYMIDNDYTTRWTGDDQKYARTIIIDLGNIHNIDAIYLDSADAPYDFPYCYICYVSLDGSHWVQTAAASGPSGTGSVCGINITPTIARYIKIASASTTSAKGWWTISEVHIRSMDAQNPPAFANSSFEMDGPTQTPSGWTTWSDHADEADYVEETGGSKDGQYHLAHYSEEAYRVTTYQNLTNLENGVYTISAWVRCSGGETTVQMEVNNFGGGSFVKAIPQADQWTQVYISDVNVTNTQCTVGFYSYAAAGQWLAVDKVEIIPQV